MAIENVPSVDSGMAQIPNTICCRSAHQELVVQPIIHTTLMRLSATSINISPMFA